MKRVAILQPFYIPWKGYFDIINSVHEFILYDDAQYSKNSWGNRNRIKTRTGPSWLTIPVLTKGRSQQRIRDVEIVDSRWASKHWKSIQTHYSRAQNYQSLGPALRELYERASRERRLSRVNEMFIRSACDHLGIRTRITRSSDYKLEGSRVGKLVCLCEQANAEEYLSGPAAKAYLDEQRFADKGIAVSWMDYSGYREYNQLFCPPFIHEVSILDLLLAEGCPRAKDYLLNI